MSKSFVPRKSNLASSIDSFGVSERTNTLFFFQRKSAGVEAVKGKFGEGTGTLPFPTTL